MPTLFPGPSSRTIKRRYKFRPGTVALRDIKKLQHSVHKLIPKLPLVKVYRQILEDLSNDLNSDFKPSKAFVEALHEVVEAYITELLQVATLCIEHRGKKTFTKHDLRLAIQLRGDPMRSKLRYPRRSTVNSITTDVYNNRPEIIDGSDDDSVYFELLD